MAGLQAPAEVIEDLEQAIADMVQVLVKDGPKFDYKGWKKKWQQAQK